MCSIAIYNPASREANACSMLKHGVGKALSTEKCNEEKAKKRRRKNTRPGTRRHELYSAPSLPRACWTAFQCS